MVSKHDEEIKNDSRNTSSKTRAKQEKQTLGSVRRCLMDTLTQWQIERNSRANNVRMVLTIDNLIYPRFELADRVCPQVKWASIKSRCMGINDVGQTQNCAANIRTNILCLSCITRLHFAISRVLVSWSKTRKRFRPIECWVGERAPRVNSRATSAKVNMSTHAQGSQRSGVNSYPLRECTREDSVYLHE